MTLEKTKDFGVFITFIPKGYIKSLCCTQWAEYEKCHRFLHQDIEKYEGKIV